MILLARRNMLALAAVIDIALHARLGPVAAKALAQRLDLPPRHLEPMLQTLVRSGILRGVRGPRGGYELARERRRITAAEVLRASLSEPDDPAEPLPALVVQVVMPLAAEIGAKVVGAFETVSIEDLCVAAQKVAEVAAAADDPDFTI